MTFDRSRLPAAPPWLDGGAGTPVDAHRPQQSSGDASSAGDPGTAPAQSEQVDVIGSTAPAREPVVGAQFAPRPPAGTETVGQQARDLTATPPAGPAVRHDRPIENDPLPRQNASGPASVQPVAPPAPPAPSRPQHRASPPREPARQENRPPRPAAPAPSTGPSPSTHSRPETPFTAPPPPPDAWTGGSRPGPPATAAPRHADPGYGVAGYSSPAHSAETFGAHAAGISSLDEAALVRRARRAPERGWRRTVHKLSGGSINPGDSPDTVEHQRLVRVATTPVSDVFRIAVLSLKGGVGKTTTTVGLGSTFASLRGDRVIAVDANPDLGTLAQRIPQQTRATVRDLLLDESIYRYSDVRAYTSQAPSRLEVLASERDPATAERFGETDYRNVVRILQRYYSIVLTDCGTGLSHSAMNGVLDLANALVLVSSPAIDGARSAAATLDWLDAHGYRDLVSRTVVVLSGARPGEPGIDPRQLSQHFLPRTRAVQQIPFDPHLAEGAEIDLDRLDKETRRAFLELAATVAEDFASTTTNPIQ